MSGVTPDPGSLIVGTPSLRVRIRAILIYSTAGPQNQGVIIFYDMCTTRIVHPSPSPFPCCHKPSSLTGHPHPFHDFHGARYLVCCWHWECVKVALSDFLWSWHTVFLFLSRWKWVESGRIFLLFSLFLFSHGVRAPIPQTTGVLIEEDVPPR